MAGRADYGREHVAGLDTLRLIAAAWVCCSHGARAPLSEMLSGQGTFGAILGGLNNGIFNGVAAVMMFFVISGFVIHRINVGRERLDIAGHYARRITRIAPPLLAIYLICALLGSLYAGVLREVLWSVYSEIAYYALYPLLFILYRRFGVERIFFIGVAMSIVPIAMTASFSYHSQLDLVSLVLIGLPSWLLGCALAERKARTPLCDIGAAIWAWRVAAIALSAALKWPVTHGAIHLGYPATHWLFAIFAFHWLSREIDAFARHPPPRWCEKGGGMSYSLYLVHYPIIVWFGFLDPLHPPLDAALGAGPVAWFMAWGMLITVIALITRAFYIFIETPSHRLARTLGALLSQNRTRTGVAWR